MVKPREMPMDESLRSSNLGDEQEGEEGVHGDRPVMDATEDGK